MDARYSNRSLSSFLRGAAFGAAAMYLLDPDKGRRRRAIARDKAASLLADAGETLCEATRDVANRAQGAGARALRSLHREENSDDLRLIERVRARIGRVVSHPHALQVGARDGLVTLSGPILVSEAGALFAAVRRVPGVSGIDDHLVVHAHPGSVPSLQGTGRRRGGPSDRFAAEATPRGPGRGARCWWIAGALWAHAAFDNRSRAGEPRRRACHSRRARASWNAGSARSVVSSGQPSRETFEAAEYGGRRHRLTELRVAVVKPLRHALPHEAADACRDAASTRQPRSTAMRQRRTASARVHAHGLRP